jgi:hypothetical protein
MTNVICPKEKQQMQKNNDQTGVLRRRFWVAPGGRNYARGRTCAVFVDIELARRFAAVVAKGLPRPLRGLWKVVPMNELELLAELKARRQRGYKSLKVGSGLNSDGSLRGFTFDLGEVIDEGKFFMFFRGLAEITDRERAREEGHADGGEVEGSGN